jgi:hypothetical protein
VLLKLDYDSLGRVVGSAPFQMPQSSGAPALQLPTGVPGQEENQYRLRQAMAGHIQGQQQQPTQPTGGSGTQGGDAGRTRMSASDAVEILGLMD